MRLCLYIYIFSIFHVLLIFSFLPSSSLSLLSFYFFPSSAARPPILLTNARNLSAPPVHRNPPFLLYSIGRLSSYPFFLLFVLTHTFPLLSAFIGLRCPAVAIVESGSLTFTSGDKYGFVQGIPGFQRRAEFSIPIRHRVILYDHDLFGANLPECAALHK